MLAVCSCTVLPRFAGICRMGAGLGGGCPMDCAKAIFARHGIGNVVQVKVTDLGVEKTKGVRATDDQVAACKRAALDTLAGA